MDIFTIKDINSFLLPIGVLGVLLAVLQFSWSYTQEALLRLFLPKRIAEGAYTMINKFFGYIGYIFFTLVLLVGAWIIIAVINTMVQYLNHSKQIPLGVFILCCVFVFIVLFTLGLIIWRAIETKRGRPIPTWDKETKEPTKGHLGLDTERIDNMIKIQEKLIEQHAKLINLYINRMGKKDENDIDSANQHNPK